MSKKRTSSIELKYILHFTPFYVSGKMAHEDQSPAIYPRYIFCETWANYLGIKKPEREKPYPFTFSSHSFKGAKCIEILKFEKDEDDLVHLKMLVRFPNNETIKNVYGSDTVEFNSYIFKELTRILDTFIAAGKTKIYYK